MKFENLKKKSPKEFRRITGVKSETFTEMIKIISDADDIKKRTAKAPGGRPLKLSVENRLLMALEYLREYRTYANIGASYGLSESKAYTNIRWIENVLIQSRVFSLPGKKALLKNDIEYEVILVDATETPIERPKKNSGNSTQERKKDIP